MAFFRHGVVPKLETVPENPEKAQAEAPGTPLSQPSGIRHLRHRLGEGRGGLTRGVLQTRGCSKTRNSARGSRESAGRGPKAVPKNNPLKPELPEQQVVSSMYVLIYREAPVTYCEDVALEDAWHEEVGIVGSNHTMASRLDQ